ncbi:putative L-type lectin-domain containing receptor kinase S.5 [Curcuma longa]|uniref:putative L-type lectin-domain containing receptor kinase S.5 n=1 Tax=Curcuma longa TaxID=136217 RepID=UPI003D9E8A10
MRSPSRHLHCCLLLILCLIARMRSLEFNYTNFLAENSTDFVFTDGTSIAGGALQLTPTSGNHSHQSGRVLYGTSFKLHRGNGSAPTSINSTFVFNIQPLTHPGGEGFAFLLTNNPPLPAGDSSGQWLGAFSSQTNGSSRSRTVAVEFDTRRSYDGDLDDNHVGLDVNGIPSAGQLSFGTVGMNISQGIDVEVSMVFDAVEGLFGLRAVTINSSMVFVWALDLSQHLDEDDVWVGFSSSTSNLSQSNQIKSWYFSAGDVEFAGAKKKRTRTRTIWLLVLVAPFCAAASCLSFTLWKKRNRGALRYDRNLARRDIELVLKASNDRPVKFQLSELKIATGNFDPNRQLGRGGFGTVYRGYLKEYDVEVAVKRIERNSRGGEREFVAEVTTISQLSHRNLVKLIGWCHDAGELLLVYEFLRRRSLDKYLFGEDSECSVLDWERRYRIVAGVAAALDYLHHGSVRRVVHRDVKASNVMLDEEFDARLGDFGLARAVERGGGKSHYSTAGVAGTRGYMAPECYFTGRAAPETDVYAFGVFAMEVACGRRPGSYVVVVHDDDDDDDGGGASSEAAYLVDWVWDLHGRGRILEAADRRLGGKYDEAEMERVLLLALACCHPNHRERPSMRAALQVLAGDAAPPNPAMEKPAFVWPASAPRDDVEMPLVGLLFVGSGGGHLTQSTIFGR